MAKLTPLAKGLITVVILGAVGTALYFNRDRVFPGKKAQISSVPPKATLPDAPDPANPGKPPIANVQLAPPGCTDKPEVRFLHWAWNAQMGLLLATGNKQAAQGSLMCKYGVNLKLTREDMVDKMQAELLAFAEAYKAGEKHPKTGAHFVAIMGDGSAAFLKGVNDRLKKLGPDYIGVVVGSAGYSRGEDKFMGPPEWRKNPQAARGGVVTGVLRDGDWNIALKWLGDNGIPNNPDEKTYDPEALNWIAAADYIDAGAKYVSGFCEDRKNVKTKATEKVCVQAVVTWTPGDVTVAEQKGGLISIVSTKEYRSQMPNVIIGNKKWMAENRELVKGMLRAIFEAGDDVKQNDEALRRAAGISAVVYNEKDAAYWYKYFTVQTEKDKQGLMVELGGSSVNNLADNLQLFGLAEGSTNLFAATYTVFGNVVKQQYPEFVPDFFPHEQITDTSYITELAGGAAPATKADLPTFAPAARVEQVVSRKAWSIEFDTGKATFTRKSEGTLAQLLSDLVIAGGTLVEIHGHTDNVGGPPKNLQLSEDRAFAVKKWLESQSPANFPEGRVKIFSHGQENPIEPNTTPEGRAKNRRVEIVMGTAGTIDVKALVARAFLPNRAIDGFTALILVGFWSASMLLVWLLSPWATLPRPGEVTDAISRLWMEKGLAPEIFVTFKLILHALLLTVLISMLLSYATVIAFFRPLVAAASKLRFLSLTGLVVPFTLFSGGGYALKVWLLTFGMTTFFVTSMAAEVMTIPRESFEHARVLGASETRILWEVVVRGTLDKAVEVLRQNLAIGWAMITMVEGISRADGGLGALILNEQKHFKLAEVYGIMFVILGLGLLMDYGMGVLQRVASPHVMLERVKR